MIEISIPGAGILRLKHLVMDFNGTLARDGCLLEGIHPRLGRLAAELTLHVVTADTFGEASAQLTGLACKVRILAGDEQASAKLAYIQKLGVDQVAAIGNGRNDVLMLRSAALGIAVIQSEGAALEACLAADLLVPDILAGLDLFFNPMRLIASLRA